MVSAFLPVIQEWSGMLTRINRKRDVPFAMARPGMNG